MNKYTVEFIITDQISKTNTLNIKSRTKQYK